MLRTKTDDGIRTFKFQRLVDAQTAAEYVKNTSADGFVAQLGADDMHGKIIDQWENHKRIANMVWSTLNYGQRQRPYADSISYTLGTEEECTKSAAKINAQGTCWASRYAGAEQLVGPLWRLTITDPFTD